MIIINLLSFLINGSYIGYVFLLSFVFGLLYSLIGRKLKI